MTDDRNYLHNEYFLMDGDFWTFTQYGYIKQHKKICSSKKTYTCDNYYKFFSQSIHFKQLKSSHYVPIVGRQIEKRSTSDGSVPEEHNVSAIEFDVTKANIRDEVDTENGLINPGILHQSRSGFVECINEELVEPYMCDFWTFTQSGYMKPHKNI